MSRDHPDAQIGPGYPYGQLAKAFVSALTHDDPAVRSRAERRAARWQSVLRGMASGKLRIGSRAPVDDLPVWATPEVVRGGFATGRGVGGAELRPHEIGLADRVGVPRDRQAVFAYCLTERALLELGELLDSGRYQLSVPEEAALLTVAWLVRSGDVAGALEVIEAIERYSERLSFVPRPAGDPGDMAIVSRESIGSVSGTIARRPPNPRVEAMRETLTVWNPFGDELLALWLDSSVDGRVGQACDARWRARAEKLRARYKDLAVSHRRSSRHENPKANLGVLVAALHTYLSDGVIDGRLQHAVDSMVARRGRPGTPEHRALRERQAANAAVPAHHLLARIVVARLAVLPHDQGVSAVDDLIRPVTAEESVSSGVAEGAIIPPSICAAVRRAIAGTPEELVERGIVPSAEVLARLVPQIAAATTASSYPDEAVQRLVARTYLAFRNRRSLLLLNLDRQVRLDELPWVRALERHRPSRSTGDGAGHGALRRLAELAIVGFPATSLPNPLVRELDALALEAQVDAPLVEELAADIFTGTFSAKYLAAAKVAANEMSGTLYERYYGIDYVAVRALPEPVRREGRPGPSDEFAALCHARAGAESDSRWSVARNGTIIEQAQILTTHNLATLVGPMGLRAVISEWPDLARRSADRVMALVQRVESNPRPLRTIKDAAYAWRQMVFYLSLTDPAEYGAFMAGTEHALQGGPAHVEMRLRPALDGLRHVMNGGMLDPADGTNGRRFQGWVVGQHWMHRPARIDTESTRRS